MLAIYKREFKSYFQSMVGCVFVAFLVAFTGIYFTAYNLNAGYPYFSYTLSGSLIVFIVGIPLGRPGPVTPWGKPALGYKTRATHNRSDKFIVKRRNGK